MKPKPWDRKLWGVVFVDLMANPILLGSGWLNRTDQGTPHSLDEPSRTLLFTTRYSARTWAREKNKRHWNDSKPYRVVRVRELVEVI